MNHEKFEDIALWNSKPVRYMAHLDKLKEKSAPKKTGADFSRSIVRVKPIDLYALFGVALKRRPNGIYSTILKSGAPLENMIWWDFLIESEIGFVHVWRTNSLIECDFECEDSTFDPSKFFAENISRRRREITEFIEANFEKHKVLINHFASHQRSIDYLWNELKDVQVNPPSGNSHLFTSKAEAEKWQADLQAFTNAVTKQHVLGKSLVLHCAFAAEGLINNILRIFLAPRTADRPDILSAALQQKFKEKLKTLDYFTRGMGRIKIEDRIIQNILSLMEYRNKIVHADESSKHSQLGEIFFDGMYPLFDTSENSYVVEDMLKTFREPSKQRIHDSHKHFLEFLEYIKERIVPDLRDQVWWLLSDNPIGFNTRKNVYSGIYPKNSGTFFMLLDGKSEKPESS